MEKWSIDLPISLREAIEKIYTPLEIDVTDIALEPHPNAKVYHATRFSLNNQTVIFRAAKKTPDRPGQFVTLWKRPHGKNMPFSEDDEVSLVVVSVTGKATSKSQKKGYFVFSKETLVKQGVFSSSQGNGKMALRVFPPWSEAEVSPDARGPQKMSASAKRTQQWQLESFLSVSEDREIDLSVARKLHFSVL